MNTYISFLFFMLCTLSFQAQIDSRKQEGTFPAIPNKTSSIGTSPLKPKAGKALMPLKTGQISPSLKWPKKEFSMFEEEEFGNPGELHTKKLEQLEKELLPEGHGLNSGLKEDTYWGDYYTKSEYVDIMYRDYSAIDGDLLNLLIDDNVIKANIYLSSSFKSFRHKLRKGFNKIEFYAVNEGASRPNTAEYKIKDQWGKTITSKVWSLSAGVKVTVIIIKE